MQAGARMVYAVEASDMAGYCKTLLSANPRKTLALHSSFMHAQECARQHTSRDF